MIVFENDAVKIEARSPGFTLTVKGDAPFHALATPSRMDPAKEAYCRFQQLTQEAWLRGAVVSLDGIREACRAFQDHLTKQGWPA